MAGRIYDRLRDHFGSDAIFMDIDSIPSDVNFREQLGSAVEPPGMILHDGTNLEDNEELCQLQRSISAADLRHST